MGRFDRFFDLTQWHVAASEDVKASLHAAEGEGSHALCLDFDFGSVSGYAVARREFTLRYPENYEISFDVRGDAAPNTLQLKLLDASGENVWWLNRPDYVFPRDWRRVRIKKRQVEFAWGPGKDRTLRKSAAVELVIARGRGGGNGTVCFDRFAFRELPASPPEPRPASVRASSTLVPSAPAYILDGSKETAWRSDPRAGAAQELTIDFGAPREFGALTLRWLPRAYASRYAIDFSDDGVSWRTVREVIDGNGGADWQRLPDSQTRYFRLRLMDGPAKRYGLAEMELKPPELGAPNAFFAAIAAEAPRGRYPRGFVGEQSYWTVLGIDGGTRQGLISEDGALEFGPRSGSLEPFLVTESGLVTWANAAEAHSLLDGYLPMPEVVWQARDFELKVRAFAIGEPSRAEIVARYTVENRSERPRVVTLALAARPFQVNPPTQFLNIPGGVAAIRQVSWDGAALTLNGERRVFPLQPPDKVITARFESGNIPDILSAASGNARQSVTDESGFASGALLYRLELPAHGRQTVAVVAPLSGEPSLPEGDAATWVNQREAEAAAAWRAKLNRVALQLPPSAGPIAETLRTALAHILVSRAGPALQPGARAYGRSWIRDGAMMSDALLRLGESPVAREFAEWYAAHQFSNGKVPCCVDYRGADPVAENDSEGELIHLIAQQYRYSADRTWLARMWPHVEAAARYMDALRLSERSAANERGARRTYYGLMPPSISHEGYSDRPAYSYWDDFWTLAGYDGAHAIAQALGRQGEARWLGEARAQFEHDLTASLTESMKAHRIGFIPGSADRGDFDPASTTIALSVAGAQARLPQAALRRTFERYWQEFLDRREGRRQWDDYTPYELRAVGAFVRLGWRKRAQALLHFFLADRRPPGWNQWAEVVGREIRHPRFLGDMPHAWVASDFINSVLDLFAYERPADSALVIAAGVPTEWLEEAGIGVERLRTPYGQLSYTLEREGQKLLLSIEGGMSLPSGGLVFEWPYAGKPGAARLDGAAMLQWEHGRELRINALPARVSIDIPAMAADSSPPR